MIILTIITVVYNSDTLIESTLMSIVNKKNNFIEYLIIDGGSTDCTRSIISKYNSIIDNYISEPDNGIYDAMNKGITLAEGKYISFLNAGDTLTESFDEIFNKVKFSELDILSFGINYIGFLGNKTLITPKDYRKNVYDPQFMYFPHPGLIVIKEIFNKIGCFDTKYKSSGDLDWLNRLIKYNSSKIYISETPLVNFLSGGMSESVISYFESREIAINYGKNRFKSYLIYYKQIIKYYFNKLVA